MDKLTVHVELDAQARLDAVTCLVRHWLRSARRLGGFDAGTGLKGADRTR